MDDAGRVTYARRVLSPPADEPTERERAQAVAAAQEIYDDTRRAVDDEIARMDAVKAWADREMDAATERVTQRLGDGDDPDVVQRRFELELQAVMTKAMDPRFDPRPPRTPVPEPAASAPKPAPVAPQPPVIAAPEISPPTKADAPLSEPAVPSASACACRAGRDAGATMLLGLLLALRLRRR